LTVIFEVSPWVKAALSKHLKEHGRCVPFAQNESVSFWPLWILWVKAQHIPIQPDEQIRAR
jgi:hypothetical protein